MFAFRNVLESKMKEFNNQPDESSSVDWDNISFEPDEDAEEEEVSQDPFDNIDFESNEPLTDQLESKPEPGLYQEDKDDESMLGKTWRGLLDNVKNTRAEKIKSTNALAMSESLGITPSEAYDNLDFLSKEVGLRGQPTYQELIEGTSLGGVTIGLALNPVTAAIGIGTFMAYSEIENALFSLHPDNEYEFGAGKDLESLLPAETSQGIKDLVWTIDTAWKAILSGGIIKKASPAVYRGAQQLYTQFVREVSTKYGLPKEVYISPDKIREFHGLGRKDVISRTVSDRKSVV